MSRLAAAPLSSSRHAQLAELSTTFSNNVLDATKAFALDLTDAADVEGLPASARALYAQQARTAAEAAAAAADATSEDDGKPQPPAPPAGAADATADAGPWRVTLDMPSYLPAMQHLRSSALREKCYRASVTRASAGAVDNAPVVSRILELRRETAELLGFETYADLSLASKMAPRSVVTAGVCN